MFAPSGRLLVLFNRRRQEQEEEVGQATSAVINLNQQMPSRVYTD